MRSPWPVWVISDISGYEDEIRLQDLSGGTLELWFGPDISSIEASLSGGTLSMGIPFRGGLLATFHGVGGIGNDRITIAPGSEHEVGGVVKLADPRLDLAWIQPDRPLELGRVDAELDNDFPSVLPSSVVAVKTASKTSLAYLLRMYK